MKFGYGPITGQVPPGVDLSRATLYEQSMQLAERAEAASFDSVWVSEHHFTTDGYLPSPMTMAGGLAARTDDIEVGTALALAPLYEPVRLAEDAAVVDSIARGDGTDGRFTLGLGLGYRDVEFEGMGVEKRERVGHLLDVVDTCRAAWNGDPLEDGRLVEYPNVTVSPRPTTDVDILIGAMAPTALQRAARIGDGYLVPPSVTVEELPEKLDIVRSELEKHDRDPSSFPIYVLRYGFAHEAGETAAWETIEDEYLYLRRKYLEWFNPSDVPADELEEKLDEQVAEYRETWREWTICGDAADWTEALAPLEDAWEGDVTAILHLRYPGMAFDDAARTVDYIGNEVAPNLRE